MSVFDDKGAEARIRDILDVQLIAWQGTLSICEQMCGSPIEALMLRALATEPLLVPAFQPMIVMPNGAVDGEADSHLMIEMQKKIGRHRVDFAVSSKFFMQRKVVIECDGHAFHEKTKEQAAKDKSRDRDLLLAGWPVMRFTGSEIFRNAYGCSKQVADFLNEPTEETKAALSQAGYTC